MRPSDLGKPDGLGGGMAFLADVLFVYSWTSTSPGFFLLLGVLRGVSSIRYIGTL